LENSRCENLEYFDIEIYDIKPNGDLLYEKTVRSMYMKNCAIFPIPPSFAPSQEMIEVEMEESVQESDLNKLKMSRIELDAYNLQMGIITQETYTTNVSTY